MSYYVFKASYEGCADAYRAHDSWMLADNITFDRDDVLTEIDAALARRTKP